MNSMNHFFIEEASNLPVIADMKTGDFFVKSGKLHIQIEDGKSVDLQSGGVCQYIESVTVTPVSVIVTAKPIVLETTKAEANNG